MSGTLASRPRPTPLVAWTECTKPRVLSLSCPRPVSLLPSLVVLPRVLRHSPRPLRAKTVGPRDLVLSPTLPSSPRDSICCSRASFSLPVVPSHTHLVLSPVLLLPEVAPVLSPCVLRVTSMAPLWPDSPFSPVHPVGPIWKSIGALACPPSH